ncbi:1-phosphofructokinase [Streptococcus devriesei]|uniref:1-phosphofructokinase n=1 Tax=Streptococcus devriesei TaxID=231233 RepID=UPI00041C5C3E|nr:1-phosphofructokinase [Streptococcus devriesei]
MITTVTLNASIDKAYYLDKPLIPGSVMRVKKTINTAGGKGLNVAKIIKLCGNSVTATGLIGGFNGHYLEDLLQKAHIPFEFTEIAGETRSCINILESAYGSTEFLEEGCEVLESEMVDFMMTYRRLLSKSDVVVISGSIPKGADDAIYAVLIELAKKSHKKVILDSSGSSFKKGLMAKPTLVKPNKDELEAFFNVKLSSFEEIVKYAKKLAAIGIDYVAVSLGSDGALLIHQGIVYRAAAPQIDPVNTVGCGDAMVGAFAVGLEKNKTPKDCLRYAVAAGTANALSPSTGDFKQEDLDWIYQEVQVEILDV